MPFNIGPGELIIVLIIALLVVGPGKLPDVGAALGKSIREFRKAATDVKESTSLEAPAPAAAPAAAPVPAAPAAVPAAPIAVPAVTVAAVPVPAAAVPAVAVPNPSAVPAGQASVPGIVVPEPAGGLPAELASADEQPTPSA